MPSSSTRRSRQSEDGTDARRARGEISCAECRRLKLKCSKEIPCSSCVRRGCSLICPNGVLSSGQGTRFILANTSQLHAAVSSMGQRIRQLEDALAILQSGVSTECHPLLRDELLTIKLGAETDTNLTRDKEITTSVDALGTLTIGDQGDAKYFGRTGGSETLFLAGAENFNISEVNVSSDADPLASFARTFPFGDEPSELAIEVLFDHLPEQTRASSLCETYLEHATLSFNPITREELIDDILTPVYKARKGSDPMTKSNMSPHKLATLFIIFAHGSLVDLTLEPFNAESALYFHLCRAALSLRSLFDSPEIATVQAVSLSALYHSCGGKYTVDMTWAIMSLAAKLAQSIGLHRESSRWNLEPKAVERRRFLFHELFASDIFYSLSLGRPPCIRMSYVDCEIPDDSFIDSNGNLQIGFYRWKFEFCREVFAHVLETTLTAEPPDYQTVLELDRLVRAKPLPPHLNMFLSPEDPNCTPLTYMRGSLLAQYRSITLIYIHRSFFVQALLDHPANPLLSPYAPSFLAAYRCASGLIKACLSHVERFPDLCYRWMALWTHLFSAAIIVGSIVARSPASTMAANAFIELGLVFDLFRKAAAHSVRLQSGLGVLARLRENALTRYAQYRTGNQLTMVNDYGEDELALFGGQTRVLFSKLLRKKDSTRSSAASSSSSREGDSPPESQLEVHPSLVEYLSQLPSLHSPQQPASQTIGTQAQTLNELDFQLPLDDSFSVSTEWNDNLTSTPFSFTDIMMGGESAINEQWKSFLQDSGLING